MKRVAIIGLGLMGGSLGLAIKARGVAGEVTGYARRAASRRMALARGVVDRAFESPEDAVDGADLSVFCTPVLSIPALVRRCEGRFKANSLVTDVGSTKAELAKGLTARVRSCGACFVGSHPIAGSEQAGLEAARADLYEGATVIVTPSRTADPRAVRRLVRFWRALRMQVVIIDPQTHDHLIARTSHLPHLIAAVLVNSASRGDDRRLRMFCGPGFRDTTRVAEGSPEMWHDIIKTNRRAILSELNGFRRVLDGLARRLGTGDFRGVERFLGEAKARRERTVR